MLLINEERENRPMIQNVIIKKRTWEITSKAIMMLLFAIVMLCPKAHGYSVDDKLKLEQWYAKRVDDVVENIVGKGKVITYVNVYLETIQTQKAKDVYNVESAVPKANKGFGWSESGTSNFTLPGIPVRDGQAPTGASKYEHTTEQQLELPQTMLKKMDVMIVVDSKVSEKDLKIIPNIAAGVLGMNRERGDSIMVQKMPFPPPPGIEEQFKKPEVLIDAAKFATVVLLVFAALMVFFVLGRIFLKDFAKMAESFHIKMDEEIKRQQIEGHLIFRPEIADGNSQGRKLINSSASTPELEGQDNSFTQERVLKHFDFVNEANVDRLSFLLRDEDPKKIAITLSFLTPQNSAYVLANIEPAKRAEVTSMLTQVFDADPDKVKEWEQLVRNKINYVVGGSDVLTEMLDTADDQSRDRILADIAVKNPALAEELRQNLFMFESIEYLDDADIKTLLNKVSNEQLAVALQGASESFIEQLLSNKTQGAQDMLKESMSLSQKMPEKQIHEVRQVIVRTARQLIKDGYITHKKPRKVEAYIV